MKPFYSNSGDTSNHQKSSGITIFLRWPVIILLLLSLPDREPAFPLTGRYTLIAPGHPPSGSRIDINDSTYSLSISIHGKFKVVYQFNLPNYFYNKELLIDLGRISEVVDVIWNGTPIGTAGRGSPDFSGAGWQNWRFYIPAGLTRSSFIRLEYRFETQSDQGGFRDHIPTLIPLDQFRQSSGLNSNPDSLKHYQRLCHKILISEGQGLIGKDFLESGVSFSGFDSNQYRRIKGLEALSGSLSITPLYRRIEGAKSILVYEMKTTAGNQPIIRLDSMVFKAGRLIGNQTRFFTDYYRSAILNQIRPFGVYLPPDYFLNSKRQYPVIFGFGGGSEIHLSLIQGRLPEHYDRLIRQGTVPPFIMITLHGSHGSAFMINPQTGQNLEESFIRELIPVVTERYRIQPGVRNRNLMGLSLGGLASISIGLRHRENFHALVSIAGVLQGIPAHHPEWNPLSIVERSSSSVYPSLLITAGDHDELGLDRIAIQFHNQLSRQGIPHQFFLFPGGHHHDEWQSDLARILNFMLQ